jgi:L-threonylcarbamoyladenylate synthase
VTRRRDPVAEASDAAKAGRLIVLPTDTVYGIGTRPDDPAATARLFAAKARPRDLELPILTATAVEARALARFDARADRLAGACWPGALTLVLPRTEASVEWQLGGDPATIGVRVPHHPLALAVLAATGPLAVTSANRSGAPAARTCDELQTAFGDTVAVYLCQDEPLEGHASSVVDLAHGPARLLRAGTVAPEALERFLPGEGPLIDSRPSP